MKYFRKKSGDCGTRGNNEFVPDSEEIVQYDYDKFVASQCMIIYPKSDNERLIEYAKREGWI